VVRRRDWLIDKKIGSVIRMRRLKLGLNQTELGDALGASFQQIQKYENGTNAVASSRISDLCKALEMAPNDLFGVSSKMDGDVSKLGTWTMRVALKLEDAEPAMRQAIDAMLLRLKPVGHPRLSIHPDVAPRMAIFIEANGHFTNP
jgi:transcriptional regulator with XRE-family HTH domain